MLLHIARGGKDAARRRGRHVDPLGDNLEGILLRRGCRGARLEEGLEADLREQQAREGDHRADEPQHEARVLGRRIKGDAGDRDGR